MLHTLDDRLGRAAAAWIDWIHPRAGRVVAVFLAATLAIAAYSAGHLGLNSDEEALFSDDLEFVRLREDFKRAFPGHTDPIVVVIDADTQDQADDAASALEEWLLARPDHFRRVHRPGGGSFFEAHGLLYLDVDDLEKLSDDLAAAQPYLAELGRDGSLRGFLTMLGRAVRAVADGEYGEVDLPDVLDRVRHATEAELEGSPRPLSWSEVILGQSDAPSERRRFLLVEPVIDFERVAPAEPAILTLREGIAELGLDPASGSGSRARMTGVFVLSYEESEHVGQQSTLAGAASFVLVAVVLGLGLRSWRLVLSSLVTLIVGLVLTAGFAAAAVGHLNLISVAFGVLFIGLSIDFAIHLCIRYAELAGQGEAMGAALCGAARDIGGSLAICALTTAVGFYAFVPTAYRGVGELGLIAGTGMFVSLFCNLTLLPALLARLAPPDRLPPPRERGRGGPGRGAWLVTLPVRHPRWVVGATAVAGLGALALLPRVEFDPNPLRLRDATTESVQTFNDLLAAGMAFPWNVNALVDGLDEARAVAAELDALPSVEYTVTLADFVPQDQEEKLEILEDTAFLLGPALDPDEGLRPPTAAERAAALDELIQALADVGEGRDGTPPGLARSSALLRETLERFRSERGADPEALLQLERSLVGTLPERLRILRSGLGARSLVLEDLPQEVVETMRATDGRMRVEVFPAEDLNDNRALARYVAEVRSVAPDAFGEGVIILESGRAVVRALLQALGLASAATFVILLALWRRLADAVLVALPLGLAALLTAAFTAVVGVPLNFANVIVIPLLLGMGVDSGIHLVHRMRSASLPDGNLLRTSTARAVLFSALTTAASFGTLGLSTHPGMASLGRLLAVGIALILVCNMIVLPALVTLRSRRAVAAAGA